MEELVPIVLFISLFGAIGFVTRVMSDNRVRREILAREVSPEVIQKVFLEQRAEDTSANLKWGMVAVALGIALAIIQVTGLSHDEPLTFSLGFFGAGAGLLGYYAMRRNQA